MGFTCPGEHRQIIRANSVSDENMLHELVWRGGPLHLLQKQIWAGNS